MLVLEVAAAELELAPAPRRRTEVDVYQGVVASGLTQGLVYHAGWSCRTATRSDNVDP